MCHLAYIQHTYVYLIIQFCYISQEHTDRSCYFSVCLRIQNDVRKIEMTFVEPTNKSRPKKRKSIAFDFSTGEKSAHAHPLTHSTNSHGSKLKIQLIKIYKHQADGFCSQSMRSQA